jgi:predicted glycosyltransferase
MRLADLGVAIMLQEKDLTAERLAEAVDDALALPAPRPHAFDLGGAAKSASLLGQWSARG